MKRNYFAIIAIFLLVGVALYGHFMKNKALPEEGYKAPSFELKGLDGNSYSLDDLEKPVIVNFWASWCGPCVIEAPMLTNLYKKYGSDVEIFAVNLTMNDRMEHVVSFVEKYQFPFPVLLDEKGEVTNLYQVLGIPISFFIDRDKTIVKIAHGLHSEEELEHLIQELITD